MEDRIVAAWAASLRATQPAKPAVRLQIAALVPAGAPLVHPRDFILEHDNIWTVAQVNAERLGQWRGANGNRVHSPLANSTQSARRQDENTRVHHGGF